MNRRGALRASNCFEAKLDPKALPSAFEAMGLLSSFGGECSGGPQGIPRGFPGKVEALPVESLWHTFWEESIPKGSLYLCLKPREEGSPKVETAQRLWPTKG